MAESKKYTKPTESQIKSLLNPLQYKVTQKGGTERPFKNKYWDNQESGIYVDIVSGEPLFSSTDKYKSGTGWPSFTKPIDDKVIVRRIDKKLWATRTEVKSAIADSHLGHVFEDGPEPTGLRYCINSASLRFIPVSELEKEGYSKYLTLFTNKSSAEERKHLVATFAGGCFWCMEPPFEKLKGVVSAVSGYMGGKESSPTYEDVSQGKTGHAEVVQITFNPGLVSYKTLVETYLKNIDPTDSGGQFADRGSQYRPEVFYYDEVQKEVAETAIKALDSSGRFSNKTSIALSKATTFWKAEDYHQDYYKKNPDHYNRYKEGSGRGPFLRKFWKK